MIKYSFIIPHHNNIKLLRRLVDSIPIRNDVEIIIVDDNSIESQKPIYKRVDVKVRLLSGNESKWAGHARNVGLTMATGKYVIFADDDDFFKKNVLDVLDQYSETNYKIIYFGCNSVDSTTLKPSIRTTLREKYLLRFIEGKPDELMYQIRVPWGKMLLRKWIMDNNFVFEEISKGNDIMFTYVTNYCADKVFAIKDILYTCTYRNDSMTYGKRDLQSHTTSIENFFKIKGFYRFIGHPEWGISFLHVLFRVLKNGGIMMFFSACCIIIKNFPQYKQLRSYYPSLIRNHLEK